MLIADDLPAVGKLMGRMVQLPKKNGFIQDFTIFITTANRWYIENSPDELGY